MHALALLARVLAEDLLESLAQAAGLARWLADEVELEVSEGAEGRVRCHGGQERLVLVEEVRERERVVLRWREPGGEASLVELSLYDAPGGTRLVVVELPVPTLRAIASSLELDSGQRRGPQMVAALA
ncbi:MAG TPA: SRPBCC domain-containing protein [Solirubrobacteraceae bacterium]|nr:SRPBCC domain-containing protein [Solirubrobacteraceae bacterium]